MTSIPARPAVRRSQAAAPGHGPGARAAGPAPAGRRPAGRVPAGRPGPHLAGAADRGLHRLPDAGRVPRPLEPACTWSPAPAGRPSTRGSSGPGWTGRSAASRSGCGRSGGSRRPASRSRPPTCSPDPPDWVADPDWMRAEGIAGFGGQPLVHRGEVLGVLAVFARGPIGPECMDWLRTIADHAAAAIATARAFERIEELTQAAGAGERVPARGGHAGRGVRRAGRPGPGAGGGRPADRPGGPDRRGRPDPRRERHGQGAGRPRGAPAEQAGGPAAGQGELRGGAARAVRERVLRPRPGGVHRRAARPGRAVRAGRRRHAVPRRGGRDPAGAPGEAAPGAPGGGAGAGRRGADPAGGRAADRRDQPRPAGGGRGRAVPAGPVLPAERLPDRAAAAAASARRTSRCWPSTSWPWPPASSGGRSRG